MMNLFAKSIEYSNGYCYVDGALQSSSNACTEAGALVLAIFIPIILLGIAMFAWWIITLVHVLSHDDAPDRVLWIVLHFVVGAIVAPIYYFVVQRPYKKQKAVATKPTKE